MEVCAEAKRVMVQALSKIYSYRNQRGGIPLHRSLLLTLVMRSARDTYHSVRVQSHGPDTTGQSDSSVHTTGQSDSSVHTTGQSDSSVHTTGQSDSSVHTTGQSDSSVHTTGQSDSSVHTTGQSDSSVHTTGQSDSSVYHTQRQELMDTTEVSDPPLTLQGGERTLTQDNTVDKENCNSTRHHPQSRKRKGKSATEPDFLPYKKARLDTTGLRRVLHDSTTRSNTGNCARETGHMTDTHIPRTIVTF
ncbi:immediate early response gene 2 protein [Tachysurus fulvidraco]|uniref:immediate early response gene 2 protein n=1 Tax=Tachysurus fulvidraco TaxID=1234273 RepID=UPI001FEE94BA|nr:immediate early response gene 2 protein [Tachysurus fulvidraco]XP_047657148.1 immediate early response gene 2 protein [Tachysurus fulvidraco]